jgi:hypothetical protein
MESWRGNLEGHAKMEVHLEALLELCFCTKPLKFGVEAHMKAPTGVARRCNSDVKNMKLYHHQTLFIISDS